MNYSTCSPSNTNIGRKPRWEPVTSAYPGHSRGAMIVAYDLEILEWLNQTQPRGEWSYSDRSSIVNMTQRVYTMFLLKYGNN